jgi:hypothetical protein
MDFDIGMLVPGLPFDENTHDTGSLGGSEGAGLYMAKALARAGQHVRIFANTKQAEGKDGVEYYSVDYWNDFARGVPHDVTIVQRLPEMMAHRKSSRLNLMWMHDLALGRSVGTLRSVMWNVDKVMVVSDYMRWQYQQVSSIPDSGFYVTRNGLDLSMIEEVVPCTALPVIPSSIQIYQYGCSTLLPRDPFKLAYAARPERGLDVLLGTALASAHLRLHEQSTAFAVVLR